MVLSLTAADCCRTKDSFWRTSLQTLRVLELGLTESTDMSSQDLAPAQQMCPR